MGNISVVNMIPNSQSGETNQDSEPNIAVNPERPTDIVGTALTPEPLGGPFAPIYVSSDGGNTWDWRRVVPGSGMFGTKDITVAFAPTGGALFAAILDGAAADRVLRILRTTNFTSTTPMTEITSSITGPDQPWIVPLAAPFGDRLYVGLNDLRSSFSATVHIFSNINSNSPGFTGKVLERRETEVSDGPPVRVAAHPDGTIYATFQRWSRAVGNKVGTTWKANVAFDVVVMRDDDFAGDIDKFYALVDAADSEEGQRVVTNRYLFFNDTMGQERLGGDLAIAVDPSDSATVWVAWCERVGLAGGTDWTLQVARSKNRGRYWDRILRTITNAKNPALAVNSDKLLGLAYQQFTGTQWITQLELTSDAWATAAETHVLHQAPSNTPSRAFFPYLGDYIRLLAVGRDFYGVFSGNNRPDIANFPSGVTYLRRADWVNRVLLNTDGVTPVATSIDPFFFHWSPSRRWPISPIIPRSPITPRGPIIPRAPILPRAPIIPRGPIGPPGTVASTAPATREPSRADMPGQRKPVPPTDLDL